MAETTMPMVRNDPWSKYGRESMTADKAFGIRLSSGMRQGVQQKQWALQKSRLMTGFRHEPAYRSFYSNTQTGTAGKE